MAGLKVQNRPLARSETQQGQPRAVAPIDRPHDGPPIPDSPAGFLKSWKGVEGAAQARAALRARVLGGSKSFPMRV
jgi:hypothetical protein